jgi:hypothetical protein
MTNYHLTIEEVPKIITDNSNKLDPFKKGNSLPLSEKEIKNELSLIFDSHICAECGHDHSFKNNFEDVKTSVDDFLYRRNSISIAIPIVGGNLES